MRKIGSALRMFKQNVALASLALLLAAPVQLVCGPVLLQACVAWIVSSFTIWCRWELIWAPCELSCSNKGRIKFVQVEITRLCTSSSPCPPSTSHKHIIFFLVDETPLHLPTLGLDFSSTFISPCHIFKPLDHIQTESFDFDKGI